MENQILRALTPKADQAGASPPFLIRNISLFLLCNYFHGIDCAVADPSERDDAICGVDSSHLAGRGGGESRHVFQAAFHLPQAERAMPAMWLRSSRDAGALPRVRGRGEKEMRRPRSE